MADVFEYTGNNPPGLDVVSKHDVVIWKHPQHGWLRVGRGGAFTPIGEPEVQKLKSTVPAKAGPPARPSATPNIVKGMNLQEWVSETERAKAEGEHQKTLDTAKFAAPERADPLAGLGLAERAEVARMVREGKSQEEAATEVRRKRKPAAETQAGALK